MRSVAFAVSLVAASTAMAQSRVPPPDQMRMMIEAGADQWIAFRDYNGRQLIYFTHFVSMKCGIAELRYSVNSTELDQVWPLPDCHEQIPFHVDPETDQIYLDLELGAAETVTVLVRYLDGGQSPVRTYRPCDVEGDVTCGLMVAQSEVVDDESKGLKPAGDGLEEPRSQKN